MISDLRNVNLCHSGLGPESRFLNHWILNRVQDDKRKSFTLIELLVVLALVAILSVVVILTLNPAELLKQARDSNRLSDLSTINTALNLFSADVTNGFMGTSTLIYVSIPDSSPTCANLGLPLIPTSTYTYSCVTTANLRNTDGTGWIPVNFQRISSNSPISQLPIDPQNTTSTKYYTYVTGGSWKVIATPESQKYLATAGTDGGTNIGQFEVGNNMSLAPFVDGLVGWWKFDEGSGTTAADSSGYGNTATYSGSGSHWSSGKVGAHAASFNGTDDRATTTETPSYLFSASRHISIAAWVNPNTVVPNYQGIVGHNGSSWDFTFLLYGNLNRLSVWNASGGDIGTIEGGSNISGSWFFLSSVIDAQNGITYIYKNGILIGQTNITGTISNLTGGLIFGNDRHGSYWLNGYIDDIRIYNRALSAAEVLGIYDATK